MVTNDVAKKDVYDKLVAKVNGIDTSKLILKTKYDTDKSKLENKIPDTNSLVKKTDYNTKITDIESKIPDISNLATKTALTAVENKIPDVSNLVKKTDCSTKVNNHNHDKYIDTPEFNKLAANVFNGQLAEANLVTKADFDDKLSNLNRKITKNKTLVQNELNKLKTFDLSYFIRKNYFEEHGTRNYLVFQPKIRYFKVNTIINVTDYVLSWQSKGLSTEAIKPPSTSNNSLTPAISYYNASKIRVKFTGSCLKKHKVAFNHEKVVNIYIVYELGASSSSDSDPTIKNCLSGAGTLTENADIDKYRYYGYGIGFDRRSSFSFPGGRFGQNIIIFGGNMNSSIHIDNKGKDILILGKGPTQGLGENSVTAEKIYSINFTFTKKKFCLSLHYNGENSYLFVNCTEICKFIAKDSEIVASPLCLRNISKDWSVDNMKRTGFTGYV